HVVLDPHFGGDVARFALCASFHPLDGPEQSRQTEMTARAFGTPLIIVYQNLTPGMLPSGRSAWARSRWARSWAGGRAIRSTTLDTSSRGLGGRARLGGQARHAEHPKGVGGGAERRAELPRLHAVGQRVLLPACRREDDVPRLVAGEVGLD